MFEYCKNKYLAPVFDVAGGRKVASDICCIFVLFIEDNCTVLTSTASAKSFNDFFCIVGSSTFRQPMHLQFSEHGIFAYKFG